MRTAVKLPDTELRVHEKPCILDPFEQGIFTSWSLRRSRDNDLAMDPRVGEMYSVDARSPSALSLLSRNIFTGQVPDQLLGGGPTNRKRSWGS